MRATILVATLWGVAGLAGAAERIRTVVDEGLNEPFGVAFDGTDRMYIVEMGGHRVSVLDPEGHLTVLAGTGERGLSGDGGLAKAARFAGPHHLALGPDHHLYVADTFNHCVRKIDLQTGIVTRVAGTGEKGFSGDGGPAVMARFDGVFSIALGEGALYVCDLGNRRVRVVDLATGVLATVAGNGHEGVPRDGEPARSQPLVDPRAIALDATGNLYICERDGHALRVVDPAGRVWTVAGDGQPGFQGDGGAAIRARLHGPKHVAVEASGDVLITDTENHVIRRYSPADGSIHLVAGTGEPGLGAAGGEPADCALNRPHGAYPHPRTGEIYVSDSENHRVIRIED